MQKQILGRLIFGSLHHLNVVNCAPRSCTWKTGILCAIDGIGYHKQKSGGHNLIVITSNLCNEVPAITWNNSQRVIYVTISAGVNRESENTQTAVGFRICTLLSRFFSLFRGQKKPININNFVGLSPEMGGGQIVYVFPVFFWGKGETHKQNSQEISRRGQDSPGTVPG